MSKATQPIPPGVSKLTPYLCIKNVAKAIEFYKQAFGAEEVTRMAMPDGRIMHAHLGFGDCTLFLSDEFPEHDCSNASPATLGKAHATMHLFVEDVDATFSTALKAGAKEVVPVADMFWGDRYGVIVDPFGQPWSIATHKEDLTSDEMRKRMETACAPAQAAAKS